MDVEYEAYRLWRISSHAKAGDIDAVEARVHRYVITILHAVAEVCSVSVDDDDVHFRMRHADRLNRILHRGGAAERVPEAAVAKLPGQEVIQLSVEPEPGHSFRLGSDRPSRRQTRASAGPVSTSRPRPPFVVDLYAARIRHHRASPRCHPNVCEPAPDQRLHVRYVVVPS